LSSKLYSMVELGILVDNFGISVVFLHTIRQRLKILIASLPH
jgi:hypothetical protein